MFSDIWRKLKNLSYRTNVFVVVVIVVLGLLLGLLLVAIVAALSAWLIQFAWTWIVPDVFAGAVIRGILPASLSFWQAVKLMILLWVLGITNVVTSNATKSKSE